MSSREKLNLNVPLQALFFLRFAQLATTTLTTYACCFYISFNVYYRKQEAPPPEYFLLFTVCTLLFSSPGSSRFCGPISTISVPVLLSTRTLIDLLYYFELLRYRFSDNR